MNETHDCLFVGDGPTDEAIQERDRTIARMLRYRGLDPVTTELVKMAWENGHDIGRRLERKREGK